MDAGGKKACGKEQNGIRKLFNVYKNFQNELCVKMHTTTIVHPKFAESVKESYLKHIGIVISYSCPVIWIFHQPDRSQPVRIISTLLWSKWKQKRIFHDDDI